MAHGWIDGQVCQQYLYLTLIVPWPEKDFFFLQDETHFLSEARDTFRAKTDYNYIAVDWSKGSKIADYFQVLFLINEDLSSSDSKFYINFRLPLIHKQLVGRQDICLTNLRKVVLNQINLSALVILQVKRLKILFYIFEIFKLSI